MSSDAWFSGIRTAEALRATLNQYKPLASFLQLLMAMPNLA